MDFASAYGPGTGRELMFCGLSVFICLPWAVGDHCLMHACVHSRIACKRKQKSMMDSTTMDQAIDPKRLPESLNLAFYTAVAFDSSKCEANIFPGSIEYAL